jgi:hypothetical protein
VAEHFDPAGIEAEDQRTAGERPRRPSQQIGRFLSARKILGVNRDRVATCLSPAETDRGVQRNCERAVGRRRKS